MTGGGIITRQATWALGAAAALALGATQARAQETSASLVTAAPTMIDAPAPAALPEGAPAGGLVQQILAHHFTSRTVTGSPGVTCDNIVYTINLPIGGGSVTGTVTTDGVIGIVSSTDIVAWNIQLNGVGASTTLTSAGGSGLLFQGLDLTATATRLVFNFDGTDLGYIGIQATPGLFSGNKYWCVNSNYTGCAPGLSVVPQGHADPSAQYQAASGLVIIGTAGTDTGTGPVTGTDASVLQSVLALARARLAQILVSALESNLLLGLNEQVSCGNCGGAGVGFGSFALSAHGRHALTPEWTVMGGADIGQYRQRGADVTLNAGFAVALQYDPTAFGSSRPYAAFGVSGALQNTRYNRVYMNGADPAMGTGAARSYEVSAFVEAGWVDRITPRDEAAVYASYARNWQIVGGYAEEIAPDNPFNAVVPGGTDVLDVASLNLQYTHLITRYLEADINGGVDRAMGSSSGLKPIIGGAQITNAEPDFTYYQVGGRLGVRLSRSLTADVFVNAILAPDAIGSSVHGGFGARWSF